MRFLLFIFFFAVFADLPAMAQSPVPPAAPDEQAAGATAAEKKLLFARGLLSRGFYSMAIQEFRLFLHDYPESPLAHQATQGLVKALTAKGKYQDALSEIETLQKRWPQADALQEIALDHGYVLLQLGKAEAAEKVLAAPANDERSDIKESALYFIAQSREQRNDTQRAMQIYLSLASKPLDETHKYRPYALFAVITATAKKTPAKAEPHLEKLLSSPFATDDMKKKALQFCAGTAFQAADYVLAEKLYDQYIRQFPNQPFVAEALKGKLRCLHNTGATDKILALTAELADHVVLAGDPEVALISAAAQLQNNQYLAALPLLQQVIDTPGAAPALREQAALMKLGAFIDARKFADAWTDGQFFLGNFPESQHLAEARRLTAAAAFELEKYAEAEALLLVLAEDKNLTMEKRTHVRHMLAVALARQNKPAQAAKIYRSLAGEAPFDPVRGGHLLAAAMAEESAGNTPAALRDYQSLLAGTPGESQENMAAANALVRLSFEQGNFALTADILTGLVEKTRGETQIRARLTLILALLHADQLEACEKQVQLALAHPPGGRLGGELDYAVVQLALKKKDMPRAVDFFGRVLARPEKDRPEIGAAVLLPLQEEFFKRNKFADSEEICRLLLTALPPEQHFEPSVRLAEILLATARLQEAENLLDSLAGSSQFALTERQSACVQSLIGEVLLKQQKPDRAFRAFEKSLQGGLADARTTARAHWGMALLLKKENRLDEALKQAVGGFVLGNDPHYTPPTMVLAAEIFAAQGKEREAANTQAELKTRYPNFTP